MGRVVLGRGEEEEEDDDDDEGVGCGGNEGSMGLRKGMMVEMVVKVCICTTLINVWGT